jgi:hypothetical protein
MIQQKMLSSKLGCKIKNVIQSGIAMGYGLDGRCSSPINGKSYSFLHSAHTASWAHLDFYATRNGGSSHLVWYWPLTSS